MRHIKKDRGLVQVQLEAFGAAAEFLSVHITDTPDVVHMADPQMNALEELLETNDKINEYLSRENLEEEMLARARESAREGETCDADEETPLDRAPPRDDDEYSYGCCGDGEADDSYEDLEADVRELETLLGI